MKSNFKSTAPLFARMGWQVQPDIDPEADGGTFSASANLRKISKMADSHPDAGVLVSTGSPSKMVVLTVDPEAGGTNTLADLEKNHGVMPATISASNPKGARLIFFKAPKDQDNDAVGVSLAPGLVFHGNGDAVLAPSFEKGDGNQMAWDEGGSPLAASLADLPSSIKDLAVKAGVLDLLGDKTEASAPDTPSLKSAPYYGEFAKFVTTSHRMGARTKDLKWSGLAFCTMKNNGIPYDPQEVSTAIREVIKGLGK